MKVLVAAASRHGSTYEIAREIHDRIARHDIPVDLMKVTEVGSLDGYDAVILGSSVYFGRWIDSAYEFIDTFEDELLALPVWLFSSGPVGAPPLPRDEESVDIGDIVKRINPRTHRVFQGKLNRKNLRFFEKIFVFVFGVQSGDYRDTDEIAMWSDALSRVLKGLA